jgi:hypothetical protein
MGERDELHGVLSSAVGVVFVLVELAILVAGVF